MRHGKKINHLSRKKGHRDALLSNMTASLILHKRIKTTLAKAKALRKYAEPLINRAKEDTTHSRRMVFRYLQSKEAVQELFNEVGQKIADRPGGYTRIFKLANRLGDNAEMAMIELVDYNDTYTKEEKTAKTGGRRRRTRRGSSGGGGTEAATPNAGAAKSEPADVAVQEEEQKPTENTVEKEEEMATGGVTETTTQTDAAPENTADESNEEENKEGK